MADTLVLETSAERREGSTPFRRTIAGLVAINKSRAHARLTQWKSALLTSGKSLVRTQQRVLRREDPYVAFGAGWALFSPGGLAPMVEQHLCKVTVVGSNPTFSTKQV